MLAQKRITTKFRYVPNLLCSFLCLTLISCSSIYSVHAEFVSGTVSSPKEGFHYLAKFCFDYTPPPPTPGMDDGSNMALSIVLESLEGQPPTNLRLYVYDDQANSWPLVYGQSDLNCIEKISKMRNSTSVDFNPNDNRWILPLARIHEHVRPRFWYLAIANCRGFGEIKYEISFTNQGSVWENQFGVNEQGLNTIYLVFFIVYCVGLAVHIFGMKTVCQNEYTHPIIKLVSATLYIQCFALFFGLLHYVTFVSNGFGIPFVKALSDVLMVVSRLTFILLLILLAQGWTIVSDRIENKSQIYWLISVFIGCYLALVIYETRVRDPASTLYIYESFPGFLIICLDILSGLWFVMCIRATYGQTKDPEKKEFIKTIGLGFIAWFLTLPAIVMIASMLDPWVREKTVCAISLIVSTIAYAAMVILLWPSRADKYFKLAPPEYEENDDDL